MIAEAATPEQLERAKIAVLGRKAPYSEVQRALGSLGQDDRRIAGKLANEVREALEAALDVRRAELGREEEERILGPGGLCHVESTTPRKVSNASETEDLVLLIVGGKGGYVERDGHMVDEADVERRAGFGR